MSIDCKTLGFKENLSRENGSDFFLNNLVSFLNKISSNATKFVAKASGNWSNLSIGDKGSIPTSADTVYIDGYSITINVKLEVNSIVSSNNSDKNHTSLNIIDTLTVIREFNVTAENILRDIDIIVNGNGVLTVNENMNFTRTANNVTSNKLQFYMYDNAKTYILGEFSYYYKNASTLETSFDIYTASNAILGMRTK